jgi:hypothetical protein
MFRKRTAISNASGPWATLSRLFVVFGIGVTAAGGYGQRLIPDLKTGGTMKLRQTDFAVLEQREPRDDLPCTVSQIRPELSWDFTFHTGYRVAIRLSELADAGTDLTVLFRVFPEDHPDDPIYMVQRVRVPPVEEGRKGDGEFYGMFAVGEGRYHVDWLLRDQREHICATSWDLEMKLNSKDSQMRQWVPQALVQPRRTLFTEEPPVKRASEPGIPRISVIVNFDPADPSAVRLDERDVEEMAAILRRIARDSRVEVHSFIAWSLQTHQVVYQEENTRGVHLRALGEALRSLKLGLVDAKLLASSANGPAQFAADFIREHLRYEKPDALVVLGRKTGWRTGVPRESLEPFEEFSLPAFYLGYNSEENLSLYGDPITSIIKRLHGVEYGLNRPKDFFNAWSEVVSRIVRAKQAAQASGAANAAGIH